MHCLTDIKALDFDPGLNLIFFFFQIGEKSFDELHVRDVKNFYIHPNYTRKPNGGADFDLGIIELGSEFPEWSETFKPACLDIDRGTEREQLRAWPGILRVSIEGAVHI